MRFCPNHWGQGHVDSVVGLTVFHELMHMTSIVGDGEYDQTAMVALAKRDPYKVRLNSASYTHYIA